MNDEQTFPTGGLNPEYHNYDKQRCFVGHSLDAPWREDLITICSEVLPDFELEAWYAADHFTPTKSLRQKVVELIANTRYGIYDLSYWRKDDKSEWQMPRNVFIELGIAIALNRPMLLLRHSSNRVGNLSLPQCLESISTHILEFSGAATLRCVLKERLSQWADTPPDQDWWNRFCTFGSRVCEYREAHPHIRQLGQTVHCHISDGQDTDRPDFREVVEEVLGRFDDVTYDYLDALSLCNGYDFLLCTHCQTVRSTPFAIYRITPHTAPETFIAIGMSLALETQFSHAIPKILLTTDVHDIPSLLAGYEVVVAHNDTERKTYLRKFMPQVIQLARKTTWKPRPLPFIEIVPRPVEKLSDENEQEAEQESEVYIDTIGKYGIIEPIGEGIFAIVYRVRDTESKQIYAMKVLDSELASNSTELARFQQEAQIGLNLSNPHIVQVLGNGNANGKHYIIMEYIDGQSLKYYIRVNSPMEPIQALNYTRQIVEGLNTAYKQGVVHHDIKPQNILIDGRDVVKIISFGSARSKETVTLMQSNVYRGTAHYVSPEQASSGHSADTRSDLYSVAVVLFEMLIGNPPFDGETPVDIVIKHMNEKVPSVCQLRPGLPMAVDSFIQKAMAKNPTDRFATPQEFIVALNELQEHIQTMPLGKGKQARLIVISTRQLIPLTGEAMVVGRPDSILGTLPEIDLADKTVGRRHAYLRNQQGTYTVEDLKSLNKTCLNGIILTPYKEHTLKDGDILRFGGVEVRFEFREEERSPSQDVPATAFNLDALEESISSTQHLPVAIDYIGQTISKYHIESEIGRGGLGCVYLARNLDRAYKVALKIYYTHLSETQKQNLASQETLLRSRLRHPYILPVLEVSLQQQPQYVISEYAAGGALHDRILWWQPHLLPLQEAITILSQAGEALVSIHQQGIVHRDLKPANILFNEQGEVHLADFDLAVVLDAGDDMKRVDRTGSPPYMAPEQFEGIVSRYSDQYALGCIAYELCTGSRPFSADSFVAMQFKHTQEQPLAPRLLNPELPTHIEQAILKALSKKPTERHTDVMAFVRELRGS
jgi:serine/threonine-protein kinase